MFFDLGTGIFFLSNDDDCRMSWPYISHDSQTGALKEQFLPKKKNHILVHVSSPKRWRESALENGQQESGSIHRLLRSDHKQVRWRLSQSRIRAAARQIAVTGPRGVRWTPKGQSRSR